MADHRALDLPSGLREVMYDNSQLQQYEQFKVVKGGNIHPGFTVGMSFDQQQAVFRAPQSTHLEAILSSFPDIAANPEFKGPSWEDVLDSIQKGEDAYRAKVTTNAVRSVVRHGEGVARVLSSLTELIPDEKGLSVLKGTLSFIFKMWISRIQNVARVLEVLGDIPQLLARSYEMWRCYPRDSQLRCLVKDYYETVLDSLTKLLAILLRTHRQSPTTDKPETTFQAFQGGAKKAVKKVGTVVKDIGRQMANADSDAIHGIIVCLGKSSEALNSRVDALDRQLRVDTNRAAHADLRETQAVRMTTNNIQFQLGQLPGQFQAIGNELGRQIQESRNLSDSTKSYIDQALEQAMEQAYRKGEEKGATEVLRLLQQNFEMSRRGAFRSLPIFWAELMQTGFYGLTAEDEYKRREVEWSSREPTRLRDGQQSQRGPAARLNYRTVSLTVNQLLAILNTDPELSTKDEQQILRQSHSMRPEAIGHARWLMSMAPFKDWLASSGSKVLIVDGHCGDLSIGRTSPLSVLCASLAASLSQSQSFIVLDYFCGQHSNSAMEDTGPRGLIRSLISQFLLYPNKSNLKLGFTEESLYNSLKSHHIGALCQVLQEILQQIDSSHTIFCIIDSVSDFEPQMQGWGEELNIIIDCLLQVTDSNGQFPPVKLLLTSATRSRLVQSHKFNPSEHISLMARQVSSRPLHGRGFDRDVRQLMQSTPVRGNTRLLPETTPPERNTSIPWSRSNVSQDNLQGSLQPDDHRSPEYRG